MAVSTNTYINLDGVKRKFGEKSMRLGRLKMANQALADMNRFVPNLTSTLRQSGHAIDEGRKLEWRTPYAKAMFYGSRPFRRGMPVNVIMWSRSKPTTSGTGKRWDLKARKLYGGQWARAFKDGSLL